MAIDGAVDSKPISTRESWKRHSLEVSLRTQAPERLDLQPSMWINQSSRVTSPETSAKLAFAVNLRNAPENLTPVSRPSSSVADFVRHRFIPEYVAIKRSAGRAHFYAILKHVLMPEEIDRIRGRDAGKDRSKLTPVPAWPYISKLQLSEVDVDVIQRLVSAALQHGYSIQTATHIRNVIRAIFSHAALTGHFSGTNPALRVVLPAMSRRESHCLTLAQVGYLLQALGCPERDLALFTMLADMSVAEICGLQWKYVNLSNTSQKLDYEIIPPFTIAVRKQSYRGEITAAVGSRRRFVRTPQPLCLLLRDLKSRSRFATPQDFVLASRKGTPLHPENIAARRLKSVGKSFGMDWLSWSVFRRTGLKLKGELARGFDEAFEKILFALSAPFS